MKRPTAIRILLVVASLAVAFFLGTRVSPRGSGPGAETGHEQAAVPGVLVGDEADVTAPFPEVVVLHLVEQLLDGGDGAAERPLGVDL